jgi:2-polyprenyl-3-methyl-5-hydroxy-6-metoxy-1,4-benzoquinol methylase
VTRLTPPRRYDAEYLEDEHIDERLVMRSLEDVRCSNTVFLGAHAVIAELRTIIPTLATQATLLDVGTGLGDIPRKAEKAAARMGVSLQTIGIDAELVLMRHARMHLSHGVCGDARSLPFADRSVDVVCCSQVLHHFRDGCEQQLLREMNRVARVAVIVSDVRRSWLAAAGFWAASFPLRFHPITRHDGVVSVMRGFTPAELGETVHRALGVHPHVRRRIGFRVTTSWCPVST